MRATIVAFLLFFSLQAPLQAAELARITSKEYGLGDVPEMITVIVADKDGNLRIEGYSIVSEAMSSGGQVKTTHKMGDLRDLMIFQAKERRMLVVDRGECQVMSSEGAPTMPAIPADAMAEMQAVIAQMEKENPALAEMMKQKAASSNMLGAAMQERRKTIVEKSGDNRRIGDYDTTGFRVYEEGKEQDVTKVWAADIDDVEGGRIVGNAMIGFFGAYEELMQNMGVGGLAATGMASAVTKQMKDYYPIETKHARGRTSFVKAETGGEAEFYPDCN